MPREVSFEDPNASQPWWDSPGGSKHLIVKKPERMQVPAKLLERALAIAREKGDKEANLKMFMYSAAEKGDKEANLKMLMHIAAEKGDKEANLKMLMHSAAEKGDKEAILQMIMHSAAEKGDKDDR